MNYFNRFRSVSTSIVLTNFNGFSLKRLSSSDSLITTHVDERELKFDRIVPYGVGNADITISTEKPLFEFFNIAAYANKSSTLREFVKLGVNLHKIEKTKGAQEIILRLDFDKDVKQYIQFLNDIGVSTDDLGDFITKNPFIFKEDIDNLVVRINYLLSKNFSEENISRIVTKNPKWLLYKTQNIDDRLGFFQNKFLLEGADVRFLTVRMPKIITNDLHHIEETHFSVKEEFGFTDDGVKALVLKKPKIFTISRRNLVERFDYLHLEMGLDHKDLINNPEVFVCRTSRLRERHEFLKALGRVQYNPQKPGYISPSTVISNTDKEFCCKVCKVSLSTYNKFLKTLC